MLRRHLTNDVFVRWTAVTWASTNLRVLLIDPQGITGTSIEYFSLPWKSITAHGVRTAGKYLDWDSEVMFWTEMDFWPGRPGSDDTPPEPPRPEQSYLYVM